MLAVHAFFNQEASQMLRNHHTLPCVDGVNGTAEQFSTKLDALWTLNAGLGICGEFQVPRIDPRDNMPIKIYKIVNQLFLRYRVRLCFWLG